MIYGVRTLFPGSHSITKINHGNYEISIVMHEADSVCNFLSCSDIRVYDNKNDEDITSRVFDVDNKHAIIAGQFQHLLTAMEYIDELVEIETRTDLPESEISQA